MRPFAALFFVLTSFCLHAQDSDLLLKDSILTTQIKETVKEVNKKYSDEIADLNKRYEALLDSLQKATNVTSRVRLLTSRTELLEARQAYIDSIELKTFIGNEQVAVVNLLGISENIKPLDLFTKTKEFFSELENFSDLSNYKEFNDWFAAFRKHAEEKKNKELTMSLATSIIQKTAGVSNLVAKLPVVGPYAQVLFSAFDAFTKTQNKEDKTKSREMIALYLKLSDIKTNTGLIDHEWENLKKDLDKFKDDYNIVLAQTLKAIQSDNLEFQTDFLQQTNTDIKLAYYNDARQIVSSNVQQSKKTNPDKWKTKVFEFINEVQNLKIRFGTITLRMQDNIKRYKQVLQQYAKDENREIASRSKTLVQKLDSINEEFLKNFNPEDYVRQSHKMYTYY